MTPTEIEEKLRKTIAPMLPSGFVLTNDTPLFYDAQQSTSEAHRNGGGAGLDSLDRVELVIAIEEEFGIEIADEDVVDDHDVALDSWNTLAGIAGYLKARI